jgi:hypothetical protein
MLTNGDVRPSMIRGSAFLTLLCMPLLSWMESSAGTDDFAVQQDALIDTFEQPLRMELLKKGYTPRNAAIASGSLLDEFARCLVKENSANAGSESQITTIRLGGAVIVTYESPCLAEFMSNVASLP